LSTLRTKIIVMGLVLSAIPVVVLVALTGVQQRRLNSEVGTELDRQMRANVGDVSRDMYALCQTLNDSVRGAPGAKVDVASLRKAILSTHVGKTGYVFVIGGSGAQQGHYIISKGGKRDGENIWGAKDAGGNLFIQSMVNKALTTADGEIFFTRYPWKNEGEDTPRMKIAGVIYFKPWDWVIGVSAYEDEFGQAKARVGSAMRMLVMSCLLGGLIVLAAGCVATVRVSGGIIRPLKRLGAAADRLAVGDADVTVDTSGKDEIGDLSRAMSAMVDNVRSNAESADKVAEGDLTVEIKAKCDKDVLANSMIKVVDTLRSLVGEANMLTEAAVQGKLETRGAASKFEGGYRQIVQGVNDTLDAVIGPLNVAAEYVEQIGKGEIPNVITDDYNGDFNAIKNNLNQCIEAVNALVADTNGLIQASLDGKLDTRADASKHHGDYAKIIAGINEMLDAVILPVNEAAAVLEKLADSDLTARVTGDYKGDLAKIKNSLNSAMETLDGAVQQVAGSATGVGASSQTLTAAVEEVGKGAQQIVETINEVASGSQEQSKLVQSSSAALDQLGRAIQDVTEGAQNQARTVGQTAAQVAQISTAVEHVAGLTQAAAANGEQVTGVATTGGKQVSEAIGAMDRIKGATDAVADMVKQLGESSQKIGAIVETIDDIAEQTNLLALNAAIEAARAGEHGKGFAVVADEVRKLAERSSKATGEIAELIGSIQQMTGHAVEAMNRSSQEVQDGTNVAGQAGEALTAIQEAVLGIVKQIQEVSAATQQVSSATTEVVRAIENVSAITEETTAATEEMAASSSEVITQTEQVAAVSQQNAASAQEVSATAEEQNASVEEMTSASEELSGMAATLQELVGQFKTSSQAASNLTDVTARVASSKKKKAA